MKTKFLVFLALAAVVLLLFFFVAKPQLVCWDEGGYLWEGYQVSQALRAGDWQSFWQLSRSQFYYPFFQSWFLAFATLPFGYTVNTTRLVSACLLLPTVVLVWLIGRQLDKKNRLAAFLTTGLVLTSPLILYYYSTVMKEGIGLLLTLLCLWLYMMARERNKWPLFLLAGIACLILTLTKYNYGVLVLAVIVLESLLGFSWKNIILFLPVAAGLGWWFSPPGYLKWFGEILQNKFQVNLDQTTILGHLLYYPLELAFSYLFSWPVLVFLVIGFVWALLKGWRNYKIRLLAIFFLLNFVLAERHMANNQARFIFTSVPVFFLVGSWGLINLWPKARGFLLPVFLIGSLVMLRDFVLLPQMIRPSGSHQVESAVFYEQDFRDINRFNFSRSTWPKIPPPADSEKIENVFQFILDNVDLSKIIRLIGPTNEISPGLFDYYIAKAREKRGIIPRQNAYREFIVAFEVELGSRFDIKDYRNFTGPVARAARLALENAGAVLLEEKEFPYLGLAVAIYGN